MSGIAKQDEGWPELHRVRRTILVVDVVESVRLMQLDEAGTVDRWRRMVHEVRTDVLPKFGGRMVKSLGDGMLLEFGAVPTAVSAAMHLNNLVAAGNRKLSAESMIWLRAGVHVGEVTSDDLDIYGPAVNLAARLSALAEPGGIVASAQARDELTPGLSADIEDMGECFLKHIDRPVRCFRVRPLAMPASPATSSSPQMPDSLLPVVAVLPFRNRSGDAPHDAIGDAIADDLITTLSQRRDWRVISRLSTAVFRANGTDASMANIQRTLNASFVLDGSYALKGRRLRIQFALSHARLGTVLWAGHASVGLDSLFAGEDEALHAVVAQIGQAIDGSELRKVGALPLPTLESYSLYLGGTNLLNRLSPDDFNHSRDVLMHVSERVPRAASPQAMLAKWHVMRMTQGWTSDVKAEGLAARSCATRALQLEPHHAYALAVDGLVATQVDSDLALARRRYDAAIAADPQEPYAWAALSGWHAYTDDGDSALTAARRAIELSPLDPSRFMFETYLAVALVCKSEFQAAIDAARRSLRLNRALTASYRILVVAQVMADRVDEARETARTLLALEPHQTLASFQHRYPGRNSKRMPQFVEALRIAGIPA